MMVLYSGTTCPYSHRCRFVLFEKGMDFEIRDVDLFAKPEDIALMNPYNEVPILVERDLILYESHIINEYIDERFPHPQLMPGDPVARARVRLFLLNFEKAARRAFVDLKHSFMLAVAQVDEERGRWLREQVRRAHQPEDLLLLRGHVFACLTGTDDHLTLQRRALRRSLDSLFPDSAPRSGFMSF